jgi:hypothetical protein
MKLIRFLIPFVFLIVCPCTKSVDENHIKEEIRDWWDSTAIDYVIIKDTQQSKDSLKVLAAPIIWGDTLKSMMYKFEKFEKGWQLTKGPLDEFTRQMLMDKVVNKRLAPFKSDMHTFQLYLEDFATMAEGLYPTTLDARIMDVYPHSRDDRTMISLLPDNVKSTIVVSSGDTSKWLPEYAGKIIYFPGDIMGNSAKSYTIKGSVYSGFIDLTLKSQ